MADEAEIIQADIPRLKAEIKRDLEAAQRNLEAVQREWDALALIESRLRRLKPPESKHSRLRDLVLEILGKAESPLSPGEIVERAKQRGWEFTTDRNGRTIVNSVLARRKRGVKRLPDGKWTEVR
jgi:hypothetical protein